MGAYPLNDLVPSSRSPLHILRCQVFGKETSVLLDLVQDGSQSAHTHCVELVVLDENREPATYGERAEVS